MNRGGRGNKRRYDDNRHNTSRSNRPSWLEAFDREVDRTRSFAIAQHGRERGIPVISFSFIGEQQVREAHGRLNSGRGSDLRERITPATRPSDSTSTSTERAAKRQKKGKDTEVQSSSVAAERGPQEGTKKESGGNSKVDKEAQIQRFDAELDDYFNREAGDAKPTKKEQAIAPPAEKSHEEQAGE